MQTKENQLLRFGTVLFGLLRNLSKLPSIVKSLRELSDIGSEAKVSVGSYLQRNAELYPEQPAILFENERYTHKQFNGMVNRYANALLAKGIEKGDVINAFLENRPEILFLLGAASKTGAIVSLVNPNQRGPSLLHSFTVTSSNHFVIGEERIEEFEEIREDLGLASDVSVYFLADRNGRPQPEGYLSWAKEIEQASEADLPTTAEMEMSDPFAYLFTSGTTGLPKAAITQNGRWVTPLKTFGEAMMRLTSTDTIYIPLPFYHGTAMYVGWPCAAAGGAAIAMRRKFSTSNFWNDVRRYNVTAFVYIGELCRYLMLQPESPSDDDNTISKIVGNGLRPDIWQAFKARFGIKEIYEFYGASEGNIAFANFLNLDCTVGFCPMTYAIVRYDLEYDAPIRDANGFLEKVGKGESGLLLGKIDEEAPFVGYTDTAETERKIIRDVFETGDAWFNTGDLMKDIGYKHAQFVDRLGDTFRWKGENVSTTEVEAVVNGLPYVSESNIFGVHIPGADGRAGMAAVITGKGLEGIQIDKWYGALRAQLPVYAVPVFLRFKERFDTTDTLKLKKADLKKDGFDPSQTDDPIFVRLPGESSYTRMTRDLYEAIMSKDYAF